MNLPDQAATSVEFQSLNPAALASTRYRLHAIDDRLRVHPVSHQAASVRSNRRDRRAFFVLSTCTIDMSRLSGNVYFLTYLSALPMNTGKDGRVFRGGLNR
jgi:hypothetical protein